MKEEEVYDYKDCLTFAGANVLAYESFGSYQGRWLAKVEYEGKQGWISDYYGSCTGCDAFESEFSYNKPKTRDNLIIFAKEYLDNIRSYAEVYADIDQHSSWDTTGDEMADFMKLHEDAPKE